MAITLHIDAFKAGTLEPTDIQKHFERKINELCGYNFEEQYVILNGEKKITRDEFSNNDRR